MKFILIVLCFLLMNIDVQAQASAKPEPQRNVASDESSQCQCGTYEYDYTYPGNSTNHYRLIDGITDAALVRDTERSSAKKYVRTEIQMEWPGVEMGFVPAFDQLANDGERLCIKGKISTVRLTPNAQGVSESLSYFEFVENIFPPNSGCKTEPIRIDLKSVKKAKLPH